MMLKINIFSPALAALLLAAPAWAVAQSPSTATAPSGEAASGGATAGDASAIPDPQLKISPLKILEQFEPPADAAYLLGAGDTIDLYVAGHPELSHSYMIGPDGIITLQIAGPVNIANLTREDAEKAVEKALSAYYTNPSATVGVSKYGSNTIMIFGNVSHPGILQYEGTTPTLLDAISRAGMTANPSSKDGLPDRCTIYRGDHQQVNVELRQLLTSGSPLSDLRLRRGDMIFIPLQQQQFVSVLGQVQKPGAVTLTADTDLRLALSNAGGISDSAGSNPTIHIAQAKSGREITISYKQLLKPAGGREVRLEPGDVIFVPKSGFNKVTYVLTKLSPVATMVSLGALMMP